MKQLLKYAVAFAAGVATARLSKHVSVDVDTDSLRAALTRGGEAVSYKEIAQSAHRRFYVEEDANTDDIFPYVCSECGRNYDWENGAPAECPHCGGDLIQTE